MKVSELSRLPKIPLPSELGKIKPDFVQSNKKNKNYIFIEGEINSSDAIVYQKVIKQDKCELIPSGSKNKILDDSKEYSPNQAYIVDRDYDAFELDIQNLFYTDKNDIESTAIYLTKETSRKIFENMKIDKSSVNDKDFEEIFNITLDLSKKMSGFNKLLFNYNLEHPVKYKYLFNLYDNSTQCMNMLKNVIDKKNNIKANEILKIYSDKYDNFSFNKEQIENSLLDVMDSFRGHDFFVFLSYMFQKYNVKLLTLDNKYTTRPNKYLEERFIKKFAEDKKIMDSLLYKKIITNTENFFI